MPVTENEWAHRPGDKKRVVVVGAGVAGMTVAHELVERGYEVEVIEMAPDPYSKDASQPDALVGGMARTSWASVKAPPDQFPLSGRNPGFSPLSRDRAPPPLIVEYDQILPEIVGEVYDYVNSVKVDQRLSVMVMGVLDDRSIVALNGQLRKCFPDKSWDLTSITCLEAEDRPTFQLTIDSVRIPGEHGFRFFPSFYRNMFDTMKRIPIGEATVASGPLLGAAPIRDSARSAFDALRSGDNIELGLDPVERQPRSYKIPRHPMRSPQEIRQFFANVLERAGYRAEDVYRLATRYLEYLTSSPERRCLEYEKISWSSYLGLYSDFSPYFVKHVNSGAQALIAMGSEKNDARTIGSVALQLTLDQLRPNQSGYTDATLRGPTSLSLFGPWQAYLESQNVRFTCGSLVGFVGIGMAVRPAFGALPEGEGSCSLMLRQRITT
jgi:hypothetical protein